jgi:heterodisulfide reductase subunit C
MPDTQLMKQINVLSGQTIQLCYHCHKCTAGCPAAYQMEYGPDRLVRMIQLGQKDRVLSSQDPWLCASCETCSTRCPNEIDIARMMDALRMLSVAEGVAAASESVKFNRLFLGIMQRTGRMHEATIMGLHKLWTGNLFADLDIGIQMILKGKLPILPTRIKGRDHVKRIFEAVEERDSGAKV